MSKVHEDNAGYVGVSYEETQDPYFSYNKLSLPLSESQLSAKQPAEETFAVTVAGGKFVVGGVSQASLSLVEGGVYKFDQSDSSNAGHPLRFSYTEDGTHGGGLEYTLGVTTNGTPGQSGAYTKIVVPFGLHDLYYYCSNHPGMGGFANVAKDPFKFTTGLPILKTTDAFGASTPLIDTSQYENTIDWSAQPSYGTNQSPVYHPTQAYAQSNASGYQSITVYFNPAIQNVTNFKYVGGAFSGEYILKINGVQVGGTRTTSSSYAEESVNISSTNVTSIGVESVGNGNGWTLGSLKFNDTDRSGTTIGLGEDAKAEDPFAAYLVLAVPMADGDFSDVHADIKGSGNNKNVDISGVTSASQSRLYGSSGEFLGATDHLQFWQNSRTDSPDFAFAANEDFTVEAWIWWDSDNQTGNNGSIVADYYEGSVNTSPNWQFVRKTGGVLGIWWNNNGTTVSIDTGSGFMSNKNWHHVAVQREASTFKFFVDGILRSSHSNSSYSNAIGRGRSLWVGIDANETSEDFCGYMQDLRVYKGVAKYTTPFPTGEYGFDAIEYEGNGGSNSINTLLMKPDLVWLKNVGSAGHHCLYDSVRGPLNHIQSSSSTGNYTESTGRGLSAFNADGFTINTSNGEHVGEGNINVSGNSYAAWCWRAGGTPTTDNIANAGSVPTAGSVKIDGANLTTSLAGTIPATRLTASTKYGFSVVKYVGNGTAGATIAHGLNGSAPKFILLKSLETQTSNSDWTVHHTSVPPTKTLYLNSSGVANTSGSWNGTAPGSSVFTVGAAQVVNTTNKNYIAYCWSEVPGFSKFGEFTGLCTSAKTVTLGFRPKFLIIKGKDTDSSPSGYRGWGMYQDVTDQQLMANCGGEQGVRGNCAVGSSKRDIQANVTFNDDGFTVDSCWFEQNDTVAYVYAAWGEEIAGDPAFESILVDQLDLKDRSGNDNNASNAGATWQTSVSKFYDGASGFLGGTNTSRVTIPSSNDFVLDGDFTIETWLYLDPAYSNTYRGIFQGSLQETGGISTVYHCSITSSTINFGVHASSGNASQAVVTNGAWHHIAIVRSGSNLTFWVNGSPAGSATETRTLTNNGNDLMIGQICDGSSTKQPLNGYLQDFRWYKGIAKYSSSFSPPERSVQGTARRYPSGIYVVS